MKSTFLFLIGLLASLNTVFAQISTSPVEVKFEGFTVSSSPEAIDKQDITVLSVKKDGAVIIRDTVKTDVKLCTGFAFPAEQPFKDYFIFSKHEPHNGKTYILNKKGDYKVIAGGTFWAGTRHKLLFILAERDLSNLIVYSLNDMKVMLEKFNCDVFTDWYFYNNTYFGNVETECKEELHNENEIGEFMNPYVTEKYDVKSNSLGEAFAGERDLKLAKKLIKYCDCK